MKCASLSLLLLCGCGYTSQYVPPADGRARPLWHEDHLTNNLAQVARPPGCEEQIYWMLHPEAGHTVDVAPVMWVPRYFGPDLVVVTPGVPPRLLQPPLFSPSVTVAQAIASAPSANVKELSAEVLMVLAVAAIVVLPVVDVVLAVDRPEAGEVSADSIDRANAYNDLQRSGGNPCARY